MDLFVYRVTRWSGSTKPGTTEIQRQLDQEGLEAYQWSDAPGNVYGAHSHSYGKAIYVVEGSITFGIIATGERVNLGAGDRLDLPPGVLHDAVVGPRGVVCLEVHIST
jgi:quercetin dioxygenase-like cupin family protein